MAAATSAAKLFRTLQPKTIKMTNSTLAAPWDMPRHGPDQGVTIFANLLAGDAETDLADWREQIPARLDLHPNGLAEAS